VESVQIKATSVVMSVLVLAACAATTPAPRFSAVSPADEDAPEAATPPAAPALAGEPEAQPPYSCPMHPEVKQASPGSCPKCGTQLVKRREAREQP
jgi:Heavy metal binding domain